jgi:protein tyrosine kinase modulator
VELRTYWTIIWRRIWVVALVVAIVALYVGYQFYHLRKIPGALKEYSSSITIQIGLQPTSNGDTNSANYVIVSEALADAMVSSPILTSHEFDTAISNQIAQDMSQIQQRYGANADLGDWQNPSAIGQALSANRVHSLVTIDTNWTTPAGAWAIANAVGEVSVANIGTYLDYMIKNNSTGNFMPPKVSARVITAAPDSISVAGSFSSKVTLYILMLLVALVLGIALTFLLDYLDDCIRSKDDVTQLLGIPIYAVIPRAPSPGRTRSSASQK